MVKYEMSVILIVEVLHVDSPDCGYLSCIGFYIFKMIICHTWCQFLVYKSVENKENSGMIKHTVFSFFFQEVFFFLHRGGVYIVRNLEFIVLKQAIADIAGGYLGGEPFLVWSDDKPLSVSLDSIGQM